MRSEITMIAEAAGAEPQVLVVSRSRSPGVRRYRSPSREGSEERRAKIEQWNREMKEAERASKTDTGRVDHRNENDNHGYVENKYHYHGQEPTQHNGYGY